jgi:hypothetical protein
MSTSSDSRFYRNVVKHWHAYTGGRHVAVYGVTPDDILQDAFVAAIESGDVTDGNVPTFGPMYMHTRQATESAVFTYRRGHSHSTPYTAWTWTDWQAWADENAGPRLAYSTDSNVLAEWQAFDAARLAHTDSERYHAGLAEYRSQRIASLDEARASLAALVMSGMTVGRIARLIGRTVDAIAAGLDEASAPTVSYLSAFRERPLIDGVQVENDKPMPTRRYPVAQVYDVAASVLSPGSGYRRPGSWEPVEN